MPDVTEAMQTGWLGLPPAARRWAAVVVVLALAGAGAMWAVGQQQQRAVLYSGLTPQGASRVITALESRHIAFQLAQDGTEILVDPERVAAVRMQLAGDGLPTEHVGFGLFDHLPLGASETVERVDYTRALEGELADAVEALAPVQAAQVLLALPQDSTFTSDQKPGRASVLVRMQPGATLDGTQVKAITHLIASSVQGIDPSAVSVVDDAGRLLASGGDPNGPDAAASTRTELERSLESRVHDQIASLVSAVAGPGKSVIEVHAELSGAAVHTIVSQAAPGAPISQQQVQEQYATGVGGATGVTPTAPALPAPAPGGAPGKIPTYGTAAAAAGATTYNKTEQVTNFQIATQQTDTHDPGDEVQRIAVTVFVDNAVSAAVADQISKAIQGGYLDPKRGDTVTVTRVAFWAGRPTAIPAPARAKLIQASLPVPVLAGGAGGFLVLFAALLLLLRRRRPAPAAPPQPTAVPVAAHATTSDPSPTARGVVEWVKQNPAVAAEVVHRWVGNGSTTNGGAS